MDGQQQPDLGTRANSCIEELHALRNRAKKAQRSHRTSPTRDLLIQVLNTIDDRERSLETWITEFSKELQTADHFFSSILRLRLESHLRGDLHAVSDRIDDLHAQNKILLVRPTEEAGRKLKKKELLGSTTQPYNAFLEFFSGLQLDGTTDIRSSVLQELWSHFPQWGELDGKVGNAEDPGDGLLYDEDWIAKAKSVLGDLHKAWSAHSNPSTFPPPSLPDMAKICLILTGMQQQHLLEDFLEHQVVDEDLPIEKPKVQEILKNAHANYASLFYTEQRRVVPRQWDEGEHLEIEEEEPLPLVVGRELNSGSYGAVIVVHDPFSKALYARKQQLTGVEDHENESARRHLERETKRLKSLRHRHVVHLVKSYRRGRAYGILLRPAAHTDLERLILRYHENKFDALRNCKHREWIRPVFMNAFGCLSQGLAYIHGRDIRHKDVKPANILYIGKVDKDPQRLLWADFGLAYDFNETGDSKTKSNKVYSKRYAAPEIMALSTVSIHNQGANVQPNLDRILEDGAEMILDAPIESDFKEERESGHGRKTDIFALGCVFLELLACLLEEKLPMDQKVPRAPQGDPPGAINFSKEVQPFSEHITELQDWTQYRRSSAPTSELAPLMGLAARMISRIPEERPMIDEVVQIIARSGRQFFCDTCWQDHHKDERIKLPDGPTQPQVPDSPPSPTDSLPRRIFNRVNSASATGVFQRVDSGLHLQLRGRTSVA
ncbi:MAG: hypothetical protein Q9166_005892 [cf. Caloplaca sp. 2 TL-2023]